MARIKKMESGGKSALGMKSVKAGFDKNPGVTRADIIVAAKKEAKYGKKVKKAQDGSKVKVALRTGQLKRLGKLAAKNPDKAEKVGSKMVERATRRQRGKEYIQKNLSDLMPKSKGGSKLKKAQYGTTTSAQRKARAAASIGRQASAMRKARTAARPAMKMGGSMGKCKYGC